MVLPEFTSEVNYKLVKKASPTVTRELSVGGKKRTVKATNKIATYEKTKSIPTVGEQKIATFAAITTPVVEVLGKTFNPVGNYDHEALVNLLASEYNSLTNVRRIGSRQITVLGAETKVSKFAAQATSNSQTIDVYIRVTRIQHEGDYVIPVGIYPRKISDEGDNILELMRNLNHPTHF